MVSRAGHCTYSAGCLFVPPPLSIPRLQCCYGGLSGPTPRLHCCNGDLSGPLATPFFNVDVNVRCSKEWVCLEAPAFNERLCKATLKRGGERGNEDGDGGEGVGGRKGQREVEAAMGASEEG